MNALEKRRLEIAGQYWNVTAMMCDAHAGVFGDPITLPTLLLGNPLCDPRQVPAEKVRAYRGMPEVLSRPVLLSLREDGTGIEMVYDGWHRLVALQANGAHEFAAWVIPSQLVWDYRIPLEMIMAGLDLVLAMAEDGHGASRVPLDPREWTAKNFYGTTAVS